MASFLDKNGLIRFFDEIQNYFSVSFVLKSNYEVFLSTINSSISSIYSNMNYLNIPKDILLRYDDGVKAYVPNNLSKDLAILTLLKFINKLLLIKNISTRSIIRLENILQELLSNLPMIYLGRLPYNEIYNRNALHNEYGDISFDIYLNRCYSVMGNYTFNLVLIPISSSNSYTLNSITGEKMIRYLDGDPKNLSSYKFYRVDLVTDSPFKTKSLSLIPGLPNDSDKLDKKRLIHLYNKYDVEYTIRYPRYLNGLLTFLKIDSNNNITLADRTPDVVDGTYNEVILTQNTGLYMYGNICTSYFQKSFSENIGFTISTTSTDVITTGKLLTLEGDISTIYNLLRIPEIYKDSTPGELLTNLQNFKLFHSPYIGYINMNSYTNIPFDPLNRNFYLYHRLFNNTSITTAISGIHLIGDNPYITSRYDSGVYKGILNNYIEAYKNCLQLTTLNVFIYLEGDLNLESTLKDYHINNTWISIKTMIEGSSKLNKVALLPGVEGGLSRDDFEKFSRLIKPIADNIKSEQSSWNVEIKNTML